MPVYGPASRGDYPGAAFDGTNHLVVWGDSRSGHIHGARVDTSGAVLDTLGLLISGETGSQGSPAVAFDGMNYLVVWADSRSGPVDIYGARVSVEGVVLDPDGIVISAAAGGQYVPAVAFDGTNYLVVWIDQRNDGGDIYGARVSVEGVVLNPDGIPISTAGNDQLYPRVAFGGTNYLVAWEDWRGESDLDVYGARVSVDGVVLDSEGIRISTGEGYQGFPAVTFDGTNYLVVWQEDENDVFRDIYGTRVSIEGAVLDPDGIPISTAIDDQWSPRAAFDGNNCLVVWEDLRSGSSHEIYGARVTPDGNVLDVNGFVISTSTAPDYLYTGGPISFDGTNYLVPWKDYRSGSLAQIYGARVSPDGSVLDPNGIALSRSANDQEHPATASNGTEYLAVWEDFRTGSCEVYGCRVRGDGVALDPDGIPISTAANGQEYPAVASDGTNYLVVWMDNRSGEWDIYAARVRGDGVALDPDGIPVSATVEHQAYYPAVAFDGTNYLVVWGTYRDGIGHDVYGARVSVDGAVLDPDGIVISTAVDGQPWPAVAFGGTNYLVVWDDYASGQSDIYGARVSVSGDVLDIAGIPISTATNRQFYPAIASGGTNYVVAWQDNRNGISWDIYGARVSVGGAVLDPDGIVISTATGSQCYPAIASGGTNYVVAWQDNRNGISWDIYGARVSVGGAVLDPDGIVISAAAQAQRFPAVAMNASGVHLVGYQSFMPPPTYGSNRIWGNLADQLTAVPEAPALPQCYVLYQNCPNPFNPATTVRFDLPLPSAAVLQIFDVSGGVVKTLVGCRLDAGGYSFVWNGRNEGGRQVPSGVYLCRLEAGDFVATRKMVLLR
jgi:hypothetical protein